MTSMDTRAGFTDSRLFVCMYMKSRSFVSVYLVHLCVGWIQVTRSVMLLIDIRRTLSIFGSLVNRIRISRMCIEVYLFREWE